MIGLRVFVYAVVLFMLLPLIITFPVAITSVARISFPPVGVSTRWFTTILSDTVLLESINKSFWLALCAALVAILIALPCAFVIQRARLPGNEILETWITAPRMIPQIALALALLAYFETIGIAETFLGLVISHLVITIPFAFRTILVGVSTLDRRLESSSAILGATQFYTFRRVILPQLKTGLIAAFIFTFILSFNNVTLALFLSGFGQRTLPVEMFQRMAVGGMTPVIPAISFVLAIVGVTMFIILDRTIGVYRFLAGRD
jgi:putative spermidine/putrescine transport system permease protein